MTDRAAATAAVLDEMVADIMGVKADKATKLTPLPGETVKMPSWPSDIPGAFMSKEGLRDAAKDLRRHAATLVEIADALDSYSGLASQETDTKQAAMEATKREEREADARAAAEPSFAEKFAAMQAEAQAAVFTNPVREVALASLDDEPEETPKSTWVCTTHGDEDIRQLRSPKGRDYAACGVPNCKEFQR